MKPEMFLSFLWIFSLALSGCRSSQGSPAPEGAVEMSLQITSAAFKEGEAIPKKYTCEAENVSPPLAWSEVPEGTKSLALIADDPDAPMGTWVHWVAYDLSPTLTSLPEGLSGTGTAGSNDFRKTGYGGPCPPPGKPHRYFFKLYALDTTLGLKAGATKVDVEKAMKGHILAQGQLLGTYSR